MTQLTLDARHLRTVQRFLKTYVPSATVWAFGSRVNGTAHAGSDLDLVIRSGADIEAARKLSKGFQISDLPILVDVLHWDAIPQEFKHHIEQQYIKIM